METTRCGLSYGKHEPETITVATVKRFVCMCVSRPRAVNFPVLGQRYLSHNAVGQSQTSTGPVFLDLPPPPASPSRRGDTCSSLSDSRSTFHRAFRKLFRPHLVVLEARKRPHEFPCAPISVCVCVCVWVEGRGPQISIFSRACCRTLPGRFVPTTTRLPIVLRADCRTAEII